MWVPVLKSEDLGKTPERVFYWGSPVAVFRDANGQVRALEDKCSHRGIPLSRGTVKGDTLRCDFHHFRFDGAGRCVDIPKEFGANEEFKARCTVRSYYTREVLGLVWISVENDPDAPFPVDQRHLEGGDFYACGQFKVEGDIRIWMDHFLDIPHCLWTHAETAYWGNPEQAAELESMNIRITPQSLFPVTGAVDMVFRAEKQRPVSYDWKMGLMSATSLALRKARKPFGRKDPFHLEVVADLATPVCQVSHISLGALGVKVTGWTSINPTGGGELDYFWGAAVQAEKRGIGRRKFLRKTVADFAEQHLGVEDGLLLAEAVHLEDDELKETRFEPTVMAMRGMFAQYQSEKAHLYPENSLMRSLRYGSPPGAAEI
ncbi:Rieske 2Fe-2S domain-containing protein [Streptomyces sp. NPDC091272]|uniref:Rieske 2Fe-2S domain-containing protein n=1 Tax=Streptomyces sp. NPDC091272 TaxID=3365981 RepID=UPI003811E03E